MIIIVKSIRIAAVPLMAVVVVVVVAVAVAGIALVVAPVLTTIIVTVEAAVTVAVAIAICCRGTRVDDRRLSHPHDPSDLNAMRGDILEGTSGNIWFTYCTVGV